MPITCRNWHCPKCQGSAAKQWLAEREAELLPVGYFHLVFTASPKRPRRTKPVGVIAIPIEHRHDKVSNAFTRK
jgi:hypothetical protein